MARGTKPIYSGGVWLADLYNNNTSPDDDVLDAIEKHSFSVELSFRPKRQLFGEICDQYGITISGRKLEMESGLCQYSYTRAKTNKRNTRVFQLTAACLLSKVSVQDACNALMACVTKDSLDEYRHEIAVLLYLLDDEVEHVYDELVWYTLKLRRREDLNDIPDRHRDHKRWERMQKLLNSGIDKYEDVIK